MLAEDHNSGIVDLGHRSELWVIGGMTEDEGQAVEYGETRRLAIQHLRPEHFGDNDHRQFFEVVCQMVRDQIPVNCVTFAEELRKDQNWRRNSSLELGTAMARIHDAGSCPPSCFELAFNRILAAYRVRVQAQLSKDIGLNLLAPHDAVDKLRELEMEGMEEPASMKKHLREFLNDCEKHRKGESEFWPTGIHRLDAVIGGFLPGELTTIGARPSVGKTALACTFQANMMENGGPDCCFLTQEMAPPLISGRIAANLAKIPYRNARLGRLSPPQWNAMHAAVGAMGQSNSIVDWLPRDVAKTCAVIEAHAKEGRRLFFVDYIQLMASGKEEQRYLELDRIMQAIQNTAVSLNVAIVAFAQLGRGSDKDRRPKMSDFRESGGIENYSDNAILIHRPQVNNEDAEVQEDEQTEREKEKNKTHADDFDNEAELIVDKFRSGGKRICPVRFWKPVMRFDDRA